MARIDVEPRDDRTFQVTVTEGDSATTHLVTVWPSDVQHYAPGATPEELVEASFEFLLTQEPKESILERFELPVIERYFTHYPSAMRARFGS
jgi:hypothetical protein